MSVADPTGEWFSAAVEGDVDEAVLVKTASTHDVEIFQVFGRKGKQFVVQRLNAYNQAARHSPWVVLLDLDHDAPCAPELHGRLLPDPSKLMILRIAVRAIESWLLADRKEFASFLGVRTKDLPDDPDQLDDPKSFVVDLARRSRRLQTRRELVPRIGTRNRIGPAYTSRMMEFALYRWDPARAEASSDSLKRCRAAILRLKEKARVAP